MLRALGIRSYLRNSGEKDKAVVDKKLFLGDSSVNRFMFTNITYFLFSMLDKNKADEFFKTLMPVENVCGFDVFIARTVMWLKQLSNTFELLRYVPISSEVFHVCSGPLMHQVMFAFTMLVVKKNIFDNGGKTIICYL